MSQSDSCAYPELSATMSDDEFSTVSSSSDNKECQQIFIAVMGVTGAGKSTFIKTATGREDIKIGHDLFSCTKTVTPYEFTHDGVDITLIDTPGFNDTTTSETEVLRALATWLDDTYRLESIKLSGVIYMQALGDRRVYGSTLRNLKMFRDLCGEKPMENVIFTTSGWGLARRAGHESQAVDKEAQLCMQPMFWEPMMQRGARSARFEDTKQSALDIVQKLVPKNPVVLQIQREMVDEDKKLMNTAAGHTVNEEIKKLETRYKRDLKQIKNEMWKAIEEKDQELHDALQESQAQLLELRDEARRAQDALHYDRRNTSRRHDNEIRDLQIALEDSKIATTAESRQHKADRIAQIYADQMRFDAMVIQIRDNMDKVRKEDRELLEEKIKAVQGQKDDGSKGKRLLLSLLSSIGSASMAALGFRFGAKRTAAPSDLEKGLGSDEKSKSSKDLLDIDSQVSGPPPYER